VICGDTAAGHTPADSPVVTPAVTIETSFRELTQSLPEPLREHAQSLPYRLGLTKWPGGGFEDFVILHPNRDLPAYAAEDETGPDGISLSAERLTRFRRAHHFGGFYWLLRDRLADGQVIADDTLLALRDLLFDRWARALGAATGDAALAHDVIDAVASRWQRGTREERAALRRGWARPYDYARIVGEKLRWISAAPTALLLSVGQRERATLFQHAYDLFLLSLQCIDDVSDQEEDQRLYGSSVPAALGCSAGALLRAAPKLAARGADLAAEGCFTRLAAWFDTFSRAVAAWSVDGDPVADELEAIALAGEMDGAPL
jgi:hypothetical protein